jgi:hypothetical protein
MDDLSQSYCQTEGRGKRLGMANRHVPHVPDASLDDLATASLSRNARRAR